MDDEKRKTLTLIEIASVSLSVAERGRQLLFVVKDHIEDGNLLYARGVLEKIDTPYFTEHLPRQVPTDSLLADALAVVIDAFGHDLTLIRRPQGTA